MTNDVGKATPEIASASREILPDVVALRRRLHRRPEIGLDLPETQRLVVEELERLGLAPRLGLSLSSVTAAIDGGAPGPTVLLRADMDALPLQEDTGLEFASEIDGAMHACGHDAHVAMLLGAARLIVERRADLAGRVLLMFQPGEEGRHGARLMLEEGLLDLPIDAGFGPVTRAFAIHISARFRTGTINLRPGPQFAGSGTVQITVRGAGGHASSPHLAVDPIPIAAEIVLALQSMVTRRLDPNYPVVLTIAKMSAGTTTNIIPETATLAGTMRSTSEEARERARDLIRQTAEGIASAHGATAEVEVTPGYPVTINDDAVAEAVLATAVELFGEERVARMPFPVMGSEDFSYVLQQVPGVEAYLGATPEGKDPREAAQNHSNRVVFDEPAMASGVALYTAMAERLVRESSGDRG
jgi:amidohydrolase